jgi:hypothetical protein
MTVKAWRIALVATVIGSAGVLTPGAKATTSTAYEMFGGGTLTAAGCAPGPCTAGLGFGTEPVTTTWTFGDLTGNPGGLIIPGSGVLLGEPVAGPYDCSASTVTTTGGAQNFTLDWTFTCNRTQGLGPDTITGHFGSSLGPGTFVWPGFFQINGAGAKANATCSGGFVPRTVEGQTVTSVFFGGECTADPTDAP